MSFEGLAQATQDRAKALYGLCERVITLASTLIAVTITFRGSLFAAPHGALRYGWLLPVTWIALALSVAFGLTTMFGEVIARTQAIREMVAGRLGVGGRGCLFTVTFWLMCLSFLAALSCFVAFAVLNT